MMIDPSCGGMGRDCGSRGLVSANRRRSDRTGGIRGRYKTPEFPTGLWLGRRPSNRALEGRAAAKTPLADPGAWAVLALASTAFMLGLYNAGLVNPLGATLVIPMALVFGGAVQFIVAIIEVFRGNVFGAAVFGCYGPFWISVQG